MRFLIIVFLALGACTHFDEDVISADDYHSRPQSTDIYDDLLEPDDEEEEKVAELRASVGEFKTLKINCWVREKPAGRKLHVLPRGKSLWIEEPDPGVGWYQVYTRKSLAFMSSGCFE